MVVLVVLVVWAEKDAHEKKEIQNLRSGSQV